MNHVMLDLETYGTVPGSVILSIGAQAFDPDAGTIDSAQSFYQVITIDSCEDAGLETNLATIEWWYKQSKEAQAVLRQAYGEEPGAIGLRYALRNFTAFLGASSPCVWGNGSDFDNAMLTVAYERAGFPLPWKFSGNRCYRTLKNLAPRVPMDRFGTHHNALDDARSQAVHALSIFQALGWARGGSGSSGKPPQMDALIPVA